MTSFDKIKIMLALAAILLLQAQILNDVAHVKRSCAAQIDTLQDTVLDGEE